MKYIKSRDRFILENKGKVKYNALDTLAQNSQGQTPEMQETLNKLDQVEPGQKVVTRFAPSPTGFLHIGGLRTALYNYLFAKKHDGVFYLRIEDTDQKRFVSEAEDYIKNALEWIGIEPDYSPWKGGPNGPYRQSERDYSEHTKHLLDTGAAYLAFDTDADMAKAREGNQYFAYDAKTRMNMKNSLSLPKEEIDRLLAEKAPYVIRFKTPENRAISFTDIVRGNVTFNTNQTDDKVLIKSNGIPTYHMANVCDDHDMGTTHVIRGEEWLPSTPLHLMLYEAFGWTPPKFAHLPLLLNPDGKGKLSKRHSLKYGFPVFPMGGEGEDEKGKKVQYKGFKDEGFEPDAVVNFLLLLGWNAGGEKGDVEIYSIADMIRDFSLSRVHKAGARFNIDKAKWFNKEYIKMKNKGDLSQGLNFGDATPEQIDKIMDIVKDKSQFRRDMQSVVDSILKKPEITEEQISSISPEFKSVFSDFINKDIDWSNINMVKQTIYDTCTEKGVKMNKILPELKLAILGTPTGPDLMSVMNVLGRDECLKRIKKVL
jgi:glutamyl-tRNA synthetase